MKGDYGEFLSLVFLQLSSTFEIISKEEVKERQKDLD
jgi:hypothetical protein